jgi:competence protein ComEA
MESLVGVLLEKYRLQVGISLVAAVILGGGVLAFLSARSNPPEIHKVEEPSIQAHESTASATSSDVQKKIKVDIAGAVVNPGVYEVFADARVEDVLNAAGGLAPQADGDWVSKNLNLAAKLSDGDKLYIPKIGEVAEGSSPANTSAPPPSSAGTVSGVGNSETSNCSRVNINTASVGTLDDCLPGIGPAYAQRIVEYRETHGGFKHIEEIQEVSGIGPKTFEKIKDQIVVD